MKIIKEGTIPNDCHPMRFECKKCGCVFESSHREYKREIYKAYQSNVMGFVHTTCPCCGIACKEDLIDET